MTMFIPLALFLPETCRELVRDGSVPPPWICKNFSDHLRFNNRKRKGMHVNIEREIELSGVYKCVTLSSFGTLKVLKDLESNLLMLALSFCM